MKLGLDNKTALVAASSRGLGKAVAMELAREGTRVAICARNKKTLLRAEKEITEKTGGTVKAYAADVTKKDQINNLVEAVTKEIGPVDILVNNAGGPPPGFIEDFTPEDYMEAVELNLLSAIRLSYLVIPSMKKRHWGRIIHIASVSAKQPIHNLILSNTSRSGVLGFSKSLAEQMGRFNITVNTVCPGYTKTERVESLARSFEENGKGTIADFYASIERTIPMGRLGRPEELASTVTFLASERASYITGTVIQVDGGYIKGLF